MCRLCADGYLSYAAVYNSAVAAPSKRDWIRTTLRQSSKLCYVRRDALARHLKVMVSTQTRFQNIDWGTEQAVLSFYTSTQRTKQGRTRRLLYRMLRHTYRPEGRMFFKTLKKVAVVSSTD
jgi:hypothetical protein